MQSNFICKFAMNRTLWACSAPLDVCMTRALVQCSAALAAARAHAHARRQRLGLPNAPVITLFMFQLFVQKVS